MKVSKVKKRKARKGSLPRAAGVEVRISFNDPATVGEASIGSATEADGLFYVYIPSDVTPYALLTSAARGRP